jgi:GNAT superfamily N-acetyltransferase
METTAPRAVAVSPRSTSVGRLLPALLPSASAEPARFRQGEPEGPTEASAARALDGFARRSYAVREAGPGMRAEAYARGMAAIAIRKARPGDGQALARIHADMAAYYVERFPEHFRAPRLDGLQDELDAELGERGDSTLELVAEVDGEVVGALVAQVLAPEESAEREIVPELGERRLRIEYLATDRRHQRHGVGTRLVDEAESWGREHGATVSETWTYARSPQSVPFWTRRMGYEARSVNLRKRL